MAVSSSLDYVAVERIARLRDDSVVEILDDAIRAVRDNFSLLSRLMLLTYVPWTLPVMFVVAQQSIRLIEAYLEAILDDRFQSAMDAAIAFNTTALPLTLIHQALIMPFAMAATCFVVWRRMTGRDISFGTTLQFLLQRSWKLIVSYFVGCVVGVQSVRGARSGSASVPVPHDSSHCDRERRSIRGHQDKLLINDVHSPSGLHSGVDFHAP